MQEVTVDVVSFFETEDLKWSVQLLNFGRVVSLRLPNSAVGKVAWHSGRGRDNVSLFAHQPSTKIRSYMLRTCESLIARILPGASARSQMPNFPSLCSRFPVEVSERLGG